MTDLVISEWKLLRLTVDQIGPFQEALKSVSFRAAEEDALFGRQPANLYMILAKNGHGKTTLLECLHGLMGLLSEPKVGRFANPQASGRAQADFQVRWILDGTPRNLVFSIWTGAPDPVIAPDDAMLRSVAPDATWGRLGLAETAAGEVIYDATDHHGRAFYQAMCEQRGTPPTSLFGDSQTLPTMLFFPADRRLVAPNRGRAIERPARWSYQPAQTFSSDGPEWADSIDNLLVWLDWLDDGRLPELLAFTNETIFGDGKALRPPIREELAAYVSAGGNQHPLAALSHGERALLQLYVRTACHMTRNTLVLIDEVELHLHSTWMLQMLQVLKGMLRDHPQLGIVFTTHDRELMKVFDHRRVETGLTKGGYLIEDTDAGA